MKKLSVVLGLLVLASCATNPVTGRKQLSLVSTAEVNQMSFQQYKQTLTESKLSVDKKEIEQVKRVGVKVQKAVEDFFAATGNPAHLNGYAWEYNVIQSKELNAWCMPGGKVAFYTGILPVCKDDTGVAVVMGHEIAHAIANHGAERMSDQMLVQLGGVGLAVAMSKQPQKTQQIAMQSFGVGSSLGILSFSRKHESEADEMGLIFMALAGYDPAQAPEFWKRMMATAETGGNTNRPPEFLSTHPSSETRISDLNKLMPIAQQVYKTKSIQPYLEYKKVNKK